jgi:hypothetical protein
MSCKQAQLKVVLLQHKQLQTCGLMNSTAILWQSDNQVKVHVLVLARYMECSLAAV